MSNTYLEEFFTSHNLKNLKKEPTCLETQKHVATTFWQTTKVFICQVSMRQDCLSSINQHSVDFCHFDNLSFRIDV